MDFNDNVQLDPSQVQNVGGGGGRGGGMAIGGGLGIIIMILGLLFGFNPSQILGAGTSGTSSSSQVEANDCTNTSQINSNRECRWTAYVNSIQSYWATQFQQGQYQGAVTKTFTGQVSTACGTATSEVGPFYCPGDKTVYIDTAFTDQLLQQLGAQGGDAAEAYILAHEYGHHIQDLTGQMAKAQSAGNQTGPTSPQVRLELQADCYAGAWFKNATQDQSGIIGKVTQDDLNRVIDAAAAVGDDRIQEASSGRVQPESWTHGSAKMRQYWAAKGFSTGSPSACDTFSTNDLGQ
ncbi:neutral zinc metallopeptidase [Luteococcus peritonei]|uniref:Neutral zinc metallopeptidase n=1 Tax=Luteococcus peritonei TaxID=88874 RepID=A0ABW4RR09_9ACTN